MPYFDDDLSAYFSCFIIQTMEVNLTNEDYSFTSFDGDYEHIPYGETVGCPNFFAGVHGEAKMNLAGTGFHFGQITKEV